MSADIPIPFVALHTYPEMVGFYEKLGFKAAFHSKSKRASELATMYFELK